MRRIWLGAGRNILNIGTWWPSVLHGKKELSQKSKNMARWLPRKIRRMHGGSAGRLTWSEHYMGGMLSQLGLSPLWSPADHFNSLD